ncbi:MAG: Kae1-associated kinase Bud32 [Acidilobaceae archaeon]|nr:Kae1-associated kinase Bud32 [Acidilobaceae archaeon]MCX8166191.1 Kae1-associated kinase Bud32 [Acidilobaceae archaeon]MDW7974829.1 Kae1-associated kinase Bud32 [Sulfolobales archaeon]
MEELLAALESSVRAFPLMKRGAESEVRLGTFLGLPAIFKYRLPKPYMHPKLALSLARQRSVREARVMLKAREVGVPAPRLYALFPSMSLIVMEYIEGETLKEVAEKDAERAIELGRRAGTIVARLHEAGIAHGDPTTSNFIFSRGELRVIDFGLAEFTSDVEDFAVDVHLFRRAVESAHARIAHSMFSSFLEGYAEVRGAEWVAERAEEIRLRGRYVEERRTVWGRG